MPQLTTRVGPDTTPAEPAESNTMWKQPSARTRRDKKLSEHRSNHVRPESHDTSTNIPDLHETPSNHVRRNMSPQARPPWSSTRSRAHKQNHSGLRKSREVKEIHTSVPPRMAPRSRLRKHRSDACTWHHERTR
ncbi:hypothetical protein Taro_028811 [Colocasia esculenta]|uniref:Uncharacterized protein n=1 Tax=Colocasia esculenta TaxID=4460 RepID=A0A843VHE2_COLES|nr:hypothetical protein [Colocasia esculenta]